MKNEIHPNTARVTIKCACGHTFETTSTACDGYAVEICSHCHPFFTGKQRFVDAAGKIEKFKQKYAKFQKDKTA